MTESARSPARVWQAACSFCGAPVSFQSPASPMAVCTYCRSTLVRDGDTLRRIGQSASLFDDHSPLSLGAQGRLQGEAFSLVGRIQWAYRDTDGDEGRWSEWQLVFDNGRSGCLSEDNGGYVLSFALRLDAPLPDGLKSQPLGSELSLDGRVWALAARVSARVHAMEGELLARPTLSGEVTVVELRNAQGEVLSVEAGSHPPRADVGRAVQLADLGLSAGVDTQAPTEGKLKAAGLSCPSCGASLVPTLAQTKSIVCGSCHAVVDISKGVGNDLAYYQQDNTLEPLIALGRSGMLTVRGRRGKWQVVGYQERCQDATGDDGEQYFWREYLLYHRSEGFAFLVDSEDGWSVVAPMTGVPKGRGDQVDFGGQRFSRIESYTARTTYVLGEFYWPVRKGQRTLNTDYRSAGKDPVRVLNLEQSGQEAIWSAGQVLDHKEVMQAFGVTEEQVRLFKRDAGPSTWSMSTMQVIVIVVVVILLLSLLTRCADACDDVSERYGPSSTEYQQCRARAGSSGSGYSGGSGGSYGGYNSGGFHK